MKNSCIDLHRIVSISAYHTTSSLSVSNLHINKRHSHIHKASSSLLSSPTTTYQHNPLLHIRILWLRNTILLAVVIVIVTRIAILRRCAGRRCVLLVVAAVVVACVVT